MPDILSSELVGQMSLLRAMVDPAAKEHLANTISDILEAQKDAESALSKLRDQEAKNQALLDEANAARAEADRVRAEAEDRMRAASDLERELSAIQTALTDEKQAFGEVRQKVDADHRERDRILSTRAEQSERMASKLTEKRDELDSREADLVKREERMDRLEQMMRAMLDELK